MSIRYTQSLALDAYYVERIAELKAELKQPYNYDQEAHGLYYNDWGMDLLYKIQDLEKERDDLEMIETIDDTAPLYLVAFNAAAREAGVNR